MNISKSHESPEEGELHYDQDQGLVLVHLIEHEDHAQGTVEQTKGKNLADSSETNLHLVKEGGQKNVFQIDHLDHSEKIEQKVILHQEVDHDHPNLERFHAHLHH